MSEINLRKFRFRVGEAGGVESVDFKFRGGPTAIGPTMSPSPSSGNLPHFSSISGIMMRLTGFSSTVLACESCISVSLSLSFLRICESSEASDVS